MNCAEFRRNAVRYHRGGFGLRLHRFHFNFGRSVKVGDKPIGGQLYAVAQHASFRLTTITAKATIVNDVAAANISPRNRNAPRFGGVLAGVESCSLISFFGL
ncbi:hypothetical protein [Pectobacterium sp. 1950-15]|uniref:hypothetical protein n=1 Tax=Pectobacterium sp. 1950-15 TaxID=3128982 RepID=UPI003FA75D39